MIMTITGIRPDFIRMSEVFRKLDENFDHVMVHTGQHYSKMLSDVFFEELNIRKPDYNLEIGQPGWSHWEQQASLTLTIMRLLKSLRAKPKLIIFLGDSNSVLASIPLKKEGYRIAHIEAGMRSGDRRMLEETNRIVCDHCSDMLFAYHEDYCLNLLNESIHPDTVWNVGNTIVEVCRKYEPSQSAAEGILVDIHRPENFKYRYRMENILNFAVYCSRKFQVPVKMLKFGRTIEALEQWGLKIDPAFIEVVDLMSYRTFLKAQKEALFVISDSGTAQEETALLNTPVIVPRDFTERPQSVRHGCSFMIDVNTHNDSWDRAWQWIENVIDEQLDVSWLGDGTTSQKIIDIIGSKL